MGKFAAWRKLISWRVDLVLVVLVVLVGCVYLLQPQRGPALEYVGTSVSRLAGQLSAPSRVWIDAPLLGQFPGQGLARFGDELEFLGCDAAVTQGPEGVHIWRLTLWRTRRPLPEDYVLALEIVPDDGGEPLRFEHRLGQQFLSPALPTSQWPPGQVIVDATLLPVGVDPQAGYRERLGVRSAAGDSWLLVDTPFLEKESPAWLLICE